MRIACVLLASTWLSTTIAQAVPAASSVPSFAQLDTNRNGQISREEFAGAKLAMSWFSNLDSDANQSLSRAEYAPLADEVKHSLDRTGAGPHPPKG